MERYINDEYMVYDLSIHQYILTADAVESKLNINLNSILTDDSSVQSMLSEVSNTFYDYIKDCMIRLNEKQKCYYLTDSQYRGIIQRCMLDIVNAFYVNKEDHSTSMYDKTNTKDTVPFSVVRLCHESHLSFKGKWFPIPSNELNGYGVDF